MATRTAKPTSTPRNSGVVTVSFRAGREILTGSAPTSLAVACLDDDALQDAVLVARREDRMEVLLGQGTNFFVPGPEAPATGREPVAVTAIDLATGGVGNGVADFVLVAEATDGTVSVYRNDGLANLSLVERFAINGEPSAIAVYPHGDPPAQHPCPSVPNQIGTQVLVADRLGSRVLLLDIDADGQLSFVGEFPTGLEPVALAVGEINNDTVNDGCCDNRPDTPCGGEGCPCVGDPQLCLDVATANDVGQSVSVLIADEHQGGFEPAHDFGVGGFPSAISLGNFDGDAGGDVAVALPLSDEIAVYQQLPGARYVRAYAASVPRPSTVQIVDDQSIRITGDGIPDLLALCETTATLSLFAGVREMDAAPFNLRSQFTTGLSPMALVAAETDRDTEALADLLIAQRDSDRVMAMRGRGNGSFIAAVSIDTPPGPLGVVIGDFNSDSRSDVVTANEVEGTVSMYPGRGDGVLRSPIHSPVLPGPSLLVAADVDGNGSLEIAVVSRTFTSGAVYAANGDGSFSHFRDLSLGGHPVGMQAGDLEGDGRAELVFAYDDTDVVDVFRNIDGQMSLSELFTDAPASDAGIGDVNGDGRDDVVATIRDRQEVNVWFQLSSGELRNPPSVFPSGAPADRLVLADFNEDGRVDAATANHDAMSISVLFAQSGGFGAPLILPLADQPMSIQAGDFNQDSNEDILVLSDSSGRLSVVPGDGRGNFPDGKISTFAAGLEPLAFAIGQLTNEDDAQPDAVVADYAVDRLTLFRNNTDVPPLPPSPRPTFTPIPPAATGGGGGCQLDAGSNAGLVLFALAGLFAVALRRTPGRSR